jgi:hypothetical protein
VLTPRDAHRCVCRATKLRGELRDGEYTGRALVRIPAARLSRALGQRNCLAIFARSIELHHLRMKLYAFGRWFSLGMPALRTIEFAQAAEHTTLGRVLGTVRALSAMPKSEANPYASHKHARPSGVVVIVLVA